MGVLHETKVAGAGDHFAHRRGEILREAGLHAVGGLLHQRTVALDIIGVGRTAVFVRSSDNGRTRTVKKWMDARMAQHDLDTSIRMSVSTNDDS